MGSSDGVRAWRDGDVPAVGFRVGGKTYITPLVASTPQAVAQAGEWRFMVRALYVAAGSPSVPGFTESQVDQVLWGELPAEPGFLAALLRVLSVQGRPQGMTDVADEQVGEPDPETDSALQQVINNLFDSTALGGPFFQRSRATERNTARNLGYVIPDPAPRGFAPPDPEGFGTVSEFLQGLRDLRAWARLSMRDIEENTMKLAGEGEPVIWLPRATVSDMLRRERLPKRPQVRAYVAACGLTQPVQVRWLAAYDRLKHGTVILAAHPAGALPKAA